MSVDSVLERVFLLRRLRSIQADPSRGRLVALHAAHKLLYMAHSPVRYRALGRLVGTLAERPLGATIDLYARDALAALAEPATPGKHVNVLQHIAGYFRGVLTAAETRDIAALIDDFGSGRVPLSAPRGLLREHVRRHGAGWLAGQVYFEPYPAALSSGRALTAGDRPA